MRSLLVLGAIAASLALTGCSDDKTSLSGKACLGVNNDTLVEALNGQCKTGDIVATKHPGYFATITMLLPTTPIILPPV